MDCILMKTIDPFTRIFHLDLNPGRAEPQNCLDNGNIKSYPGIKRKSYGFIVNRFNSSNFSRSSSAFIRVLK